MRPDPADTGPTPPPSAGAPRPPGDLRRLLGLLGPDRRGFAAGAGLGVLTVASSVALLASSAWLISAAALAPPLFTLSIAIVGVRAFAVGRGTFRYLERLVSHDVAFRLLARVRVRVFTRLEPLAPAGLPAFRRGDLLTRTVSDVDSMQDIPLRVLHPGVVAVAAGGLSVAVVWQLVPAAGAALLVALVVAGLAVPLVSATVGRRAEERIAPARAAVAAEVDELLLAAPDLLAYGALQGRLDALTARDAELTRVRRRASAASGLGAGLATLCGGLAVAAGLATGASAVRAGELPGVALAVVTLVPLAAFEAAALLPTALLALAGARGSGRRVLEVLDTAPPVREPKRPVDPPAGPWPLVLRGVSAHRAGPDSPPTVAGIDLDLPPGRRVAVIGASGAGKSTLADVLLRFLDLDAGEYRLGGTDVRRLDSDRVRRIVGLCGQDAHVFDSTLRENLLLARPTADETDLRAALHAARLLDWVDELPDGLDTRTGERGGLMSAGQRQRLALARALLADFPVLVLDEPTANLDPETADALATDLLAATAGRSTVLITHRLAGLAAVDEIVVLDRGRVVQRGTHEELLRAGGRYRDLCLREGLAPQS